MLFPCSPCIDEYTFTYYTIRLYVRKAIEHFTALRCAHRGRSEPPTKYPELDVSRVERERRRMQIEVPQVRLCLETPRSVARVESLATCPFCLPPAPSWCSSQIQAEALLCQAEALLCQAEALLCLAEERELGFACVAVQAVHRRSKPNP